VGLIYATKWYEYIYIYIYTRQPRVEYFLIYMGPSKMTYVYNGIRVK